MMVKKYTALNKEEGTSKILIKLIDSLIVQHIRWKYKLKQKESKNAELYIIVLIILLNICDNIDKTISIVI